MKFTEIAKNFNPAWFAAVMGTVVIPLVLSFLYIVMDFLKMPSALFAPAMSQVLAFWLWVLGSVGIYVFGFIIMIRAYQTSLSMLRYHRMLRANKFFRTFQICSSANLTICFYGINKIAFGSWQTTCYYYPSWSSMES